jgi:hypothetical protein
MRTLTRKTLIRAGVLAVALVALDVPGRAAELAGATLPDTLSAGDKTLGAFEGKGFADAVFSIWLGAKPPSEDLKKGMLGG